MNNHSEVSWGDVLQDDNLVWLPHALCRYSHELGLTFDDIGFITQLFSFRGPEGIHPSDSTMAKRGGFKTRNAIIDRYQRLENKGYVVREKTRISGRFSSCKYNFAPLREKLEELVKRDWASGTRKPKHRVDNHQLGERQLDGHQLDECQHKKLKVVETQEFLETQENHHPPVINTQGVEVETTDDDNKIKDLQQPDSSLLTGPVEINDDYCNDIEAKLSKLNIRSQISSIEFKKIKEMKLAGIPKKLILDTMDEVAANKAHLKDGKNIKSFIYFVPAIWEKFNALPKPYDMEAANKRQQVLLQKAKEAGL